MTDHLGYEEHDSTGHRRGNTRNAKSHKTLPDEFGELELKTPRRTTTKPRSLARY